MRVYPKQRKAMRIAPPDGIVTRLYRGFVAIGNGVDATAEARAVNKTPATRHRFPERLGAMSNRMGASS